MHNAVALSKRSVEFFYSGQQTSAPQCEKTDGEVTGVFNKVFFFPGM